MANGTGVNECTGVLIGGGTLASVGAGAGGANVVVGGAMRDLSVAGLCRGGEVGTGVRLVMSPPGTATLDWALAPGSGLVLPEELAPRGAAGTEPGLVEPGGAGRVSPTPAAREPGAGVLEPPPETREPPGVAVGMGWPPMGVLPGEVEGWPGLAGAGLVEPVLAGAEPPDRSILAPNRSTISTTMPPTMGMI